MKLPQSLKPNRDKWKRTKRVGWFLFRHVEKIVAVVVIVIALWIAWQTFGYRPLSWQPEQLIELADTTENIIKNNPPNLADENLAIFDYAVYAEQIKERIPTEPYRSDTPWRPVFRPARVLRGGFEILTAEALKGETLRSINSTVKGKTYIQWQRPALPNENQPTNQNTALMWVNLYGTIPTRQQWDIYGLTFDEMIEVNRPEYVYYELERAEIKQKEDAVWSPVIVYPDVASPGDEERTNQNFDLLWDRLIPFGQSLNRRNTTEQGDRDWGGVLLFSDDDVEPAKTYAYRIRLYLANPNYNLQESHVEEGVDTQSKFVRSDWSAFARIYVPDRTTVRLLSVAPTDSADFPRQTALLGTITGTLFLDYFDLELGHALPPVEKRTVRRGMIGNMSKEDATRYASRIDGAANVSYPDLRSDVCVLDFSGGKKLQKRSSREAQSSPDLVVAGKALLLLPDGTMQTTSTASEAFK